MATLIHVAFSFLFYSVEDEDGQFLLIEACDNLPGWLKPDIAENRVM